MHYAQPATIIHACRYGPHPRDEFNDWKELALHESSMHPEIHSRIPCPAEGCTKHYAQLKYLITHYNVHSGKLTRCPTCQKGYTDPSRASRCRQSHDRHFRCPRGSCDYSNARADLVKQHCKKKHPELGDLSTGQLDYRPTVFTQGMPPCSPPHVMTALQAFANSASTSDGEEGPAPQLSRPALAQAAEERRLQTISELRNYHIRLSGLSPQDFDATLPAYPFKADGQGYSIARSYSGDGGSPSGRSNHSRSTSSGGEPSPNYFNYPATPAEGFGLWTGSSSSSSSAQPMYGSQSRTDMNVPLSFGSQECAMSPMEQATSYYPTQPAWGSQVGYETEAVNNITTGQYIPQQALFSVEPGAGYGGYNGYSAYPETRHGNAG